MDVEEMAKERESRLEENRILVEQMDRRFSSLEALSSSQNVSQNQRASTSGSSSNDSRLMGSLSNRIEKFHFNPETDHTFPRWYDRHKPIITVDGVSLEDSAQVRLLLEKLGEREFEQYNDQILPAEPSDRSLKETVETLTEMFGEAKSLFTARFECLKIRKGAMESHLDYTGRVNRMCESAKLTDMKKDDWKALLWLSGLNSGDCDVRPRLLAFLDESAKAQKAVTVHTLFPEWNRVASFKKESQMIERNSPQVPAVKSSSYSKANSKFSSSSVVCYNCGVGGHIQRKCTKPKVHCTKCKLVGHLAYFCEKVKELKQKFGENARSSRVHKVTANISNAVANVNATRRYLKMPVNGYEVEFQLDTGSNITLLNVDDWSRIGKPELHEANIIVRNASGGEIEVLGKAKCSFLLKGTEGNGEAYVTKCDSLIGLEWIEQSQEMMYHLEKLTSVNQVKTSDDLVDELKKDFPSVFEEGLGTCTKEKAHLLLRDDARAVYRPKRPVLFSAKEAVSNELDRLKEIKVIEPITHSLWAAPIVVVRKANGNLRVCSDFSTGLNGALEDHQYPLPIPEDIFATLNGGKWLEQIDLSDAYLQVELSDESKELVVINTEHGLFRYNRLLISLLT